MKMMINDNIKNYEFNIKKVTQMLGTNFEIKNYVIESLKKHFSAYKYKDYEEDMIDNVYIDGEIVGRKSYSLILVRNKDDLINLINVGKTSLTMEMVNKNLEKLDCQKYLNIIDEALTNIYKYINCQLNEKVESINLDYSMENMLGLVSKASIFDKDGRNIEELNEWTLVKILIDLVRELSSVNGEKIIVLFCDIDHMITKSQYIKILEKENEVNDYVYFMNFISIDNFVEVNEEFCNGINVINDVIFNVPSYEKLMEYVEENYPVYEEFENKKFNRLLANILNNIGKNEYLVDVRSFIIQKLLNKALMVEDEYKIELKDAEIACIND